MEFAHYAFDVVVVLYIMHMFVKDRKPGVNSLVIYGPWNLFSEPFKVMLNTECMACARNIIRKGDHPTLNNIMMVKISFFAIMFLALMGSYLSTQLCHPAFAAAYILFNLYRLPMQWAVTKRVSKYLEEPMTMRNVA